MVFDRFFDGYGSNESVYVYVIMLSDKGVF